MGIIAKEPERVERELIPEDTYHAVCYMVIDLGTQHNETFQTDTRKVRIGWEIPELRIEIEKDGRKLDLPKAISQEFTLSLHPKAKLRQFLENWRGKSFTQEELNGFDVSKLIGANCMLQVIHKNSLTTGKTYQTVASISKLYKGMKKFDPENKAQYFSFDDDMPIPDNIPEWIVKQIQDSYEYQEMLDGELEENENGVLVDNDMPPF